MTLSRSIHVTANGIISFFFNQFSHSVVSDSLQPHGQASLAWTCQSMDITPGFSVHHLLLELSQTHVHWVSDAIQPYHPLSTPSPSVFPSIRVFSIELAPHIRWASASVLPLIQDWSPLRLTGLISLQSKGLSRVFSNTTVQKHQFFGAQLSLWSNSHIHTWLLEKP